MKWLLAMLLAFLRPGVDDPDNLELDLSSPGDDAPPQDDPPADDPPADDPPADEPPKVDRAAIEREVSEKYERELATLRANQKPAQQFVDADVEEWTRIAADPNATKEAKWYATSNLEIRATKNYSQSALAQANDVNDRTAFSTLATTEPTLYRRYAPLVEKELASLRSKGGNAPRESIYTFLLGKDMREGKFTKKAGKQSATAGTQVNRGRLPGARSDVSGKNHMTEREQRAARLEGKQI